MPSFARPNRCGALASPDAARQPSAEHFQVIAEIVLNDVAKSRTLDADVLPALRVLE
jgi:hypothetical protein